MRRYETIIVIDPDLLDDARESLIERIKEIISKYDGTLLDLEEWGLKKLAYEVKKKGRGYYVRFDYCGKGVLVREIERILRIDDRSMKYITVLLKKDVDVLKLQEEIASSKAPKDDEGFDQDKNVEKNSNSDEKIDNVNDNTDKKGEE